MRNPQEAKAPLRGLLVGRLVFTPTTDDLGRPSYQFSGQANLNRPMEGRLLSR